MAHSVRDYENTLDTVLIEEQLAHGSVSHELGQEQKHKRPPQRIHVSALLQNVEYGFELCHVLQNVSAEARTTGNHTALALQGRRG